MDYLDFTDKFVSYETFLNDIAASVVHLLKADSEDPEFISQRKAYQIFGRRNVERWRRMGKILAHKRPGKVEYRTADLRLLQRQTQDYFNENDYRKP